MSSSRKHPFCLFHAGSSASSPTPILQWRSSEGEARAGLDSSAYESLT